MPIGTKLTAAQAEVYQAIEVYGPIPDHALVPLVQHMGRLHQSSSGIRTRRHELFSKLLIEPDHAVTTGSGRKASTWVIT